MAAGEKGYLKVREGSPEWSNVKSDLGWRVSQKVHEPSLAMNSLIPSLAKGWGHVYSRFCRL